jgi:hypothetical protein
MMPLYGPGTARATDVRQAADFMGQGAIARDDQVPLHVVPAQAGTQFRRLRTQTLVPRLRGEDGLAGADDRIVIAFLP